MPNYECFVCDGAKDYELPGKPAPICKWCGHRMIRSVPIKRDCEQCAKR